ncbi:winged helix-turn-helix transcriptional regulator [Paenibacillus tyrfis]|uniref:winged helix-turn-helix transcriptional regulator n=1 Tax=Paenibacillus tyrfis TaxID=1501230 RepID=UPI000B58D9C0|nr:helix-turn-helix domain-containing protein [Paenibacillus tyrfis]
MDPISNEEECMASVEEALQIFGGKWSFLVLRQLFKGPQRFNQLRRNLDHISTKSLTDILRHLEEHEIIRRQVFPTVPVTVEYSLTDRGKDFQTILVEMGNWARKWGKPRGIDLSEQRE